jgi:hypothetical protein
MNYRNKSREPKPELMRESVAVALKIARSAQSIWLG